MTDIVGGLEIQLLEYAETRKIEKVTGSQDDDFVAEIELQLAGNTKRSKKSRAPRMTVLSQGVEM